MLAMAPEKRTEFLAANGNDVDAILADVDQPRVQEMTEHAREDLRAQAEQLETAARRLPQQLGRDELLKDILEFRAKLSRPHRK
jgi:hypothetical protein